MRPLAHDPASPTHPIAQVPAMTTAPTRIHDDRIGDAYDRLAACSPQASIYCQRWWLDAVAPGQWQILSVGDKQNLHAAWPIVTHQQGRSGRTDVVMPAMTQKLGILLPPPNPKQKYAEQLSRQHQHIEALIRQLPTTGSFQHNFHEAFTNHLPFCWNDFEQTARFTYLLPDLSDLDQLWTNLRTAPRTAIRAARDEQLEVTDTIDFEEMLDLNALTFARQGMAPPVSRELLRRIDQACLQHAGRKIVAARDPQGRLHAAVYIVYHDRVAYHLLVGSDPGLRRFNGVALALWEAIRFASTVADVFDFEGSMMRNVEQTNRAFGGRQTPYSCITKPGPLAIPARALRKVRHLTGKFKTHLNSYHRAAARNSN
ncbi:MAG: GNAT family N-acetyltransferase [Phycisphaeraceae bacterium]